MCICGGAHVACVLTFLFAVCLFVLRVETCIVQTLKITAHATARALRNATRAKWETLSDRSGLPRHTERHLVRAYCTDNQNASRNAIITQKHPRQLYYTHSKGHITLLTHTQRDMSLKAAGRAGCLPSR